MEVQITGKLDDDPRSRILAIEGVTRSICELHGHDPAEGIMMLLTAAAHLTSVYTGKPSAESILTLAGSLGNAVVASDDFFKLRPSIAKAGSHQ